MHRHAKQIRLTGAAVVIVLLVGGVSAGDAWGTQWLKNGASLTVSEFALTVGSFVYHHAGGLAGTFLVRCNDELTGSVGPGSADRVEKAYNLQGFEVTKAKPLNCEVELGNAICKTGALVLTSPTSLPWATKLLLEGSFTYDSFEGFGYEAGCGGFTLSCSGKERARFVGNQSGAAAFEFLGELTNNCSDGGTSTTSGRIETLGFAVS